MRSISAWLLLSVTLVGLSASTSAQSVAAPQKTAPTLAERLDRLAAEIDRNRIDLHVPGAALAIVRGDEVIFARGFGLADVEKKTPVTPDTAFFIGSTTKAFTATLVGMLVDEGRMHWDDPVEKLLPEFKLAVQSKDPNDRATLRDVMSHRTGFTRMGLLETNTGLSSDEILRRASSAEAFAPFRQRFLYNNVHFLAAGSAAGVAAGTSWRALVKARILDPLGMAATRTSVREAWNDPRTARGYWWDEAGRTIRPLTFETMGFNIDGIAPAGAISSTAVDMTAWLRFLLRQGTQNGKALISPAALTTTWTPQIAIGGTAGYGMGWMVRDWQGQRLIAHDGAIGGFSAHVGLLPDSNVGFVVLTNTISPLPSIAALLVPQYLLGELPPAASGVVDLKPYLGRYIANFAAFSNEVFTISERNGRLVFDMPSKLESPLNPPRADGRWPLLMSDQLAVSFDRDKTGRVVGLKLHEGGLEYEVPREGVVLTPEIPLSELQKYVGRYGDAAGATEFAILIRNQRLAVRLPNNTSFDLLPPDATGRRAPRTNLGFGVTFEESPAGTVSAMNFQRPGALPVMRLTPVASTLPTADEIIKLRRIPAATAGATMRTTGSVRFPQSGVQGRFSSSSAGDDQLRTDLDLDGSGQILTVLNKDRASKTTRGGLSTELTGKQLAQMRLGAALFGDWRKYYDTIRVIRTGALGGRKVYGVQLESAGLPPLLVAVDAETGDVLETRQTIWSSEAMPVSMLVTTTFSDYREVGGRRVPHRYITSNEASGRAIFEVERVEVGVTLAPDTFALQPTPVQPRPKVGETITTESGLVFKFTQLGNGPQPQTGDLMIIHGIGTLSDGKEFWNTRTDGSPYEYTLGVDSVIRGFSEGMGHVREGDRIIITMTPELAYGQRERTGIPANSTLTFDYEILAVKPRSVARLLRDTMAAGSVDDAIANVKATPNLKDYYVSASSIQAAANAANRKEAGANEKVLALGLTLLPEAYQLHQTLGRLQATRGDKAAAIKSYETALKLNPKRTTSEIRDHETATAALAALR